MNHKLFTGATICVLFLAGIAGCGQKQNAAPPASPDTQSSAQGNGAAPGAPTVDASKSPIADPASPLYGWEKFSSADGKFSAIFPARPREDDKSGPGSSTVTHIFASETDPNYAYLVGYNDLSHAGDPKLILANMEAGVVKKLNGKIVSYKAMQLDNHPATEFEFVLGSKPDYSGRARLILVGQRAYDHMVIFLTAQPRADASDAFFNSFTLQQN